MHSKATGSTLVATPVGHPSVMRSLPWLFALSNELLLVLFCVLGLVPIAFLMDIVILVVDDLCQAVDGMLVDELVILT